MKAKGCMKLLWILSTAVILLLLSVCFGAVAEDLAVTLIPVTESSQRRCFWIRFKAACASWVESC